jgi:hypothetical protein
MVGRQNGYQRCAGSPAVLPRGSRKWDGLRVADTTWRNTSWAKEFADFYETVMVVNGIS